MTDPSPPPAPDGAAERGPGLDLLHAYETMVRIRRFEQRVSELFRAGELPGFVHLSHGQEAVAAGAMAALRGDDAITTTHRGHGHIIAKGGRLAPMMAELMGRAGGYCRGKAGSMHLFSRAIGVFGANGILGAGQPIACGAALAAQLRGSDGVAVTFFGEGATAQGAVHEAMNLAALWSLPIVFLVEVNGWAELTPYSVHVSVPSIAERGLAYGIPAEMVDGVDVEAVHGAVSSAVARARAGGGPTIVEARLSRWRGHYEGDPQRYRDAAEVAAVHAADPIELASARILERRLATERELEIVRSEAVDEIEAAIETARATPMPVADDLLDGVFA